MSSNASAGRLGVALLVALGCELSHAPLAWAQQGEEDAAERGPARDFDSPPPREPLAQRQFGLLALAMPYDGFGFGARALGPQVGLDLSLAYRPIFATHSTEPGRYKLALLEGYQLNAALYVGLYRPNLRTDLGFAIGYKYNTLIRHGVGAAFYLQRALGSHFAFLLFVGPAVFPRAEREIREKTRWVGGSVSSGISWHQGGLGVALVFYP